VHLLHKFSDLQKRSLSSIGLLIFAYLFFIANLAVSSLLLLSVFCILIYEWHLASKGQKTCFDYLIFLFITSGICVFWYINAARLLIYFVSDILETSMIWIIGSAILSDTGAYFIGRIFGGMHPFPNISPGKTISGYLGGLIIGGSVPLLTFLTYKSYIPNFEHLVILILLGVLLSISAMAGDLLQSYFKRKHKIKDTGSLLPGHGGFFDRFDAILATSLMALLIVLCIITLDSHRGFINPHIGFIMSTLDPNQLVY